MVGREQDNGRGNWGRSNGSGGGNQGCDNNGKSRYCNNCNMNNHWTSDCTRPKSNVNNENKTINNGNGEKGGNNLKLHHCSYCDIDGHRTEGCMNPYNDKSSNYKGAKVKGKQQGQEDYTYCEACNWWTHYTSDCTKKPSQEQNQNSGKQNNEASCQQEAGGQKKMRCEYCDEIDHNGEVCGWNRNKVKKHANPGCEWCGHNTHASHACSRNTKNGYKGQKSNEKHPKDQLSFQQGHFSQPPLFSQTVTPQYMNGETGKLNRRCKNCRKWHLDGECHIYGRPKENVTVSSAAGEFRGSQVFSSTQGPGLKWACPNSGEYFDTDGEGDIIMCELVDDMPPHVYLFGDYITQQWEARQPKNWHLELPRLLPHGTRGVL